MTDIQRDARSVLRLVSHNVQAVSLGPETRYDRGSLTVSEDDVRRAFADAALKRVGASWVSPGDSARVVKVLDAVEPRTKGSGRGRYLPGTLGPPKVQGRGETHVLRGTVILAAGHLPRAQEAVLDMSGPGARLSPFADTHNLVIEFDPVPGAPWERVDAALRRGLLQLATRVADAALDVPPDDVQTLDGLPSARGRGAATHRRHYEPADSRDV